MDKIEHYSGIRRYIASRIGNTTDAEDLTQDVFLEYHHSTHGVRERKPENPRAYLLRIARNLIAQYHKRQNTSPLVEIPIDIQALDRISHDTCLKRARTQELAEQIHHIVTKLPPKSREAVELRLIHGLAPKEATRQSGCTVDRFYDRFHKGMKILRERMCP